MFANHSILVRERLSYYKLQLDITEFGEHENTIETVLVMEQSDCLFVGDNGGQLAQYRLHKAGRAPSLVKNFGNIGIGPVCSSVSVGNFAVLGGTNNTLAVIDADRQQVIHNDTRVAVECVYSMRVCCLRFSDKMTRAVITVSGENPDYSDGKTDMLDVTDWLECSEPNLIKDFAFELSKFSIATHKQKSSVDDGLTRPDKIMLKYEKLKAKYQALKKKVHTMSTDLEKMLSKYTRVNSKKKHLKARIEELEQQISEMSDKKSHFKKRNKQIKADLKRLCKESSRLRTRIIEPALKQNSILVELVKTKNLFPKYI